GPAVAAAPSTAPGPHGRTQSAAVLGHPAHAPRTPSAPTTAARPATPDASADLADGQASVTAAAPVPQAAADLAAPLRWSDPATRQLPLGAGLTLIGLGLGLVGVKLRRG
ncbi:hypothetical protein KSNIM_38335, partial [Kitasatospora sp. DSM 101779]|nr:hypothetical protein [Kitasatospora sp. DSM 101779]